MLLYFLLCTFWQYISIHWNPLYLSLMSKVEVLSFNKCLILKMSSILLKKKAQDYQQRNNQLKLSVLKEKIMDIWFIYDQTKLLTFKGTWSNKTLDKWRLEITFTVPLNSLLFYEFLFLASTFFKYKWRCTL